MSEHEQVENLQQAAVARDRLNIELVQLQRLQQDNEKSSKRKVKTSSELLMNRSKPEPKREVDENPRVTGHFNLDRKAQEQKSEDVEMWTLPEPTPSLRDLELSQTKPLAVDVALPGLTPSSTGGCQGSAGTSRLKVKNPRKPPSEVKPSTSRRQLARGAIISNLKKDVNNRKYHRHHNEDWTSAQRERRASFNEASWVDYLTKPKISEGAVHLIKGDSLVRALTRVRAHSQIGIWSFPHVAMPQM